MALANFFERSALAASQVLAGFDAAAFRNHIEAQTLGLLFDSVVVESAEARTALELSVNLAARSFPRIALAGPKCAFAESLAKLATEINPAIELKQNARGVTVSIDLRTTKQSRQKRTIHIGSDKWVARFSPNLPRGWGKSENPFGAAVAACFGAANAFRLVFSEQLPGGGIDEPFDFSVLNLTRSASKNDARWEDADIGNACLVGGGAIGNGTCWVLSKLPSLKGRLIVVDPEVVELTNLQRYVLTTQQSINVPKVELAKSWLAGTKLEIQPQQESWGECFAARFDQDWDRLLVALDTANDRCAVQACLPRRILNAWTQPENLGISRHSFIDDDACLMCLYLPKGQILSEDRLIAQAFGMLENERMIRDMLYRDTSVTIEFLTEVAKAKSISIEQLQPFVGKPIRSFYREAVCGRAVLAFSGGANQMRTAEVPLPFQSALAGILLASELILDGNGITAERPTITEINLLRPLSDFLSRREPKDGAKRCVCQDQDYIDGYREKYSSH